jgi:hypothetical protein
VLYSSTEGTPDAYTIYNNWATFLSPRQAYQGLYRFLIPFSLSILQCLKHIRNVEITISYSYIFYTR